MGPEIIEEMLSMIGGKVESFKTSQGDAVAVVNALGIITLGTIDGATEEGASIALTKEEALRVARALIEYAA